jgi:hypothetical protein
MNGSVLRNGLASRCADGSSPVAWITPNLARLARIAGLENSHEMRVVALLLCLRSPDS